MKNVRLEYAPSVEFYFARLRITGHLSSVSACILLGLALLWSGRRVDVGDLVSQTMIERIDGSRVLCYPNLIRRLCERAGVDVRSFENGDTIEMNPPLVLPALDNTQLLNLDIQMPPPAQLVRAPQQRVRAQRQPRPAESQAPSVTKKRKVQTTTQEESSIPRRTHTEGMTATMPRRNLQMPGLSEEQPQQSQPSIPNPPEPKRKRTRQPASQRTNLESQQVSQMQTAYAESLRDITQSFVQTQRESAATIKELVADNRKLVQSVVEVQHAVQKMMGFVYSKLGAETSAPTQPTPPSAQPGQGDGTDDQTAHQPDPANQQKEKPADP